MTLRGLERRIPSCAACPRLAAYLEESSSTLQDGWCRPVPGFGDPEARLLIVGLAPGLRGANRTGRPFTGDAAGEWLFRALHETGLSISARSLHRRDGLRLRHVYLTNAVKCAPPGNRPLGDEFRACREKWLDAEWRALDGARGLLALGGDAHRQVLKMLGAAPLSAHPFGHGALHRPLGEDGPFLVDSYHPSRQNTNTHRLRWREFLDGVRLARDLACS